MKYIVVWKRSKFEGRWKLHLFLPMLPVVPLILLPSLQLLQYPKEHNSMTCFRVYSGLNWSFFLTDDLHLFPVKYNFKKTKKKTSFGTSQTEPWFFGLNSRFYSLFQCKFTDFQTSQSEETLATNCSYFEHWTNENAFLPTSLR